MSLQDVASHIERVDKSLNARKSVEDDDKTLNLSGLYSRYGWSTGACPLPEDALKALALTEHTGDPRWSKHFRSSGRHLGLYRSRVGFYWLLRYESALGEHFLDHAGTASDIEATYGS